MTQPRSVLRLHPAHRDDIGDLTTRRPVPGPGVDQIDPFLFLNHHGPQTYAPGNAGLPFGPHPHRGFETVTFIRSVGNCGLTYQSVTTTPPFESVWSNGMNDSVSSVARHR